MFDICVVGSGPSAVISAKSFIEKGHNVCLIDVGYQSDQTVPLKHFSEHLTPDSVFFIRLMMPRLMLKQEAHKLLKLGNI